MSVLLETSLGDIIIDLYTDERPSCSKNFLKLCKVKYYNFCLFHSVQRNLVAQTGDPTGSGKGGESVNGLLYGEQARYFDMEVAPRIKHKQPGLVSMVNNGSNMHGSQFFITLGEGLDYLDNVHTVFGEVAEGMDIVMKINEAYCDTQHRPYQDIRIYHTVIIDDPFDDPPGLDIPDRSPEPTKEQLDSGRIGADEQLDDFEGMSEQEVQKLLEEREAKANAQILTMIGDLPEEDVAPPENVLFVCKLNPVTTDEDLEIIFSRFGEIVSCEVIRDHKTGESLQYAFIEFENQAACENAYFKMDNVLIDDRRIHVDFSQSVAKIKWKGKGRGVEIKEDLQQDEFSSKFRIKDNTRKDSKYSLVFSDEEDGHGRGERKKKKKKQKDRRDSSSDSDYDKRAGHRKKQRTGSPVVRHRSRSNSPRQKAAKSYDKHSEKDKNRDRSDKYRDMEDSYSDRKDKGKDKRKDRDGDRYRDSSEKSHKTRDEKYSGRDDRYTERRDKNRDRDDRYRERDDKYRDKDKYRDRDDKDRDRDDKYRDRNDKYRDRNDKYRDTADKYRDRDDKYRDRDDKYREKKDRYR